MKLHSDYPYWMISEGQLRTFPALETNRKTEVAIIGAGITAALIARHLVKHGVDVTVIEKRHVAHGSTSASTALLQYEIDVPLFKLQQAAGRRKAFRAYRLCASSIDQIEEICDDLPDKAGFERQQSLYFASFPEHVSDLLKPEYAARKTCGFEVEYLEREAIRERFGIEAPAAILSGQAARVNPYLLCHYLLDEVEKSGGAVFDSTEITDITPDQKGVLLRTSTGLETRSDYVIVACGYESRRFLSSEVSDLNSTYALVTKPLQQPPDYLTRTLFWETRKPYLYVRGTSDGRVIVGGEDETFSSTESRDALLPLKQLALEAKLGKLFPFLEFQTDFAWAGTFGETEDGLPFIGACDHDRVLYALGYGGNGITFSMIAARILTDRITGKRNSDAHLFGFRRTGK